MGTPRPTEVTRDFTSTRPTEVIRDPCGQGYGCDLRRCQWCNGRCIDEHKPCPTDFMSTGKPIEVTTGGCVKGGEGCRSPACASESKCNKHMSMVCQEQHMYR